MQAAGGVPPPAVCQPYYNLLNRLPEVEILPPGGFHGLGVAPYSPIARGVLTGRVQAGRRAACRQSRRAPIAASCRPVAAGIAGDCAKLEWHAKAKGFSLVQFATAWVLANRFVTSVITGPKSQAQFEPYFGALDYPWGEGDEEIVDSLVPKGHPSTLAAMILRIRLSGVSSAGQSRRIASPGTVANLSGGTPRCVGRKFKPATTRLSRRPAAILQVNRGVGQRGIEAVAVNIQRAIR